MNVSSSKHEKYFDLIKWIDVKSQLGLGLLKLNQSFIISMRYVYPVICSKPIINVELRIIGSTMIYFSLMTQKLYWISCIAKGWYL